MGKRRALVAVRGGACRNGLWLAMMANDNSGGLSSVDGVVRAVMVATSLWETIGDRCCVV